MAACVFVAAGVGARPRRPATDEPLPDESAPTLADVASPDELELWNLRGCATCHGPQARGSQLGPDLTKVVPLYLTTHGSPDAAKAAIVAYLLDPQGAPKLRHNGQRFMNPMPAITKMNGTRDDAEKLASLLLRLK